MRRALRGFFGVALPVAMTAGLLGASPAAAADWDGTDEPSSDRSYVVQAWKYGGAGLQAAAERALLGTDADVKAFFAEMPAIQYDDDYIDASRIFRTGGPAVRKAGKTALKGTPEELQEFMRNGWQKPLAEDREVEASQVINFGGPGVKEAGKTALQAGPEAVAKFLEKGQYEAREIDNEVEVSKLVSSGGPNLKLAGKNALRGTPDDIAEFLEIGQYVARNRDQEHATVAQLTEQAKQAGLQTEAATKKAEAAAAKAVEAADNARAAALKAAKETEEARKDADRAAYKAKQAAQSAREAAAAAQLAVGAANAANRAARTAAFAAAQTANAASAAANAANNAYNAAIAAAGDATKAETANKAAKDARDAALLTKTSADAAQKAGEASLAAGIAADGARTAGDHANAAATSAEEANRHAEAAGVFSAEARNAAAEARRHANTANRAANNAGALARRAAQQAFDARDAARDAAKHAENAAAAAELAAKYAGQAAQAAADARKWAEAARVAADAATKAVNTAKQVHQVALDVEQEELASRSDAALERARSEKEQTQRLISASASVARDARTLDTTAATLGAEAAKPDVDVAATAAKGRKLALDAFNLRGPWNQDSAARALGGTDSEVLEYLRSGWKKASLEEIRDRVVQLSVASPHASIRAGAVEALKGNTQQISDFYTTGQYAVGADDLAVAVSKVNNDGGDSVKKDAKAALADGSGKALATFLEVSQYGARLTDEEVIASALANKKDAADGSETNGELRAAAKAALAGTPEKLHEFVIAGQYTAARKDDLTDHHRAQIGRILAEGEIISANAQASRWRAAEAAARANKADADAQKWAAEADKSATLANGYAKDAQKSAAAATKSADQAKASAVTARNAANNANRDADAAEASAAQAAFSANYARESAREADLSAARAKESAIQAGKSKTEAEGAASQAWADVKVKREAELAEAQRKAEEVRKQQAEAEKNKKKPCIIPFNRDTLPPCALNQDKYELVIGKPDLELAKLLGKAAWELSGAADIEKCIKDPSLGGCVMAAAGVLPIGKIKIAGKIYDGIQSVAKGTKYGKLPPCLTPKNSFPAGTPVLMGDKTTRPIEQIKPGDAVLATDPYTGVTGPRQVDATIYTPDDREFTDITLAPNSGGGSLTATGHHPFWSESGKTWKVAADLTPQDTLRTPEGSTAQIANVRHWTGLAPAYNLTVNDLHTYYVLAGTTAVLVHNTSCGPDLSIVEDQFGKKWGKHSKDYGAHPGDQAARQAYRDKITDVRTNHEDVRQGPYNPDGGGSDDYFFYRKGQDLVITKGNGEFVTLFPMDKGLNRWYENATPMTCGCKK
ncbi:polymorphic toxin-type HINT domain-containing protein [Streptomyces sp. NPDC051183]|uniref:polymorphic toxin-type HINT domain-containing protein n=1 Tax=unclassified Streptomyces TaxID=2593676 RepID=UPI003412B485